MSEQTLSPAQQTQIENRDDLGKWKQKQHGDVDDSLDVLGIDEQAETVDYSFPEATQILRADATREEWLAERRHGVGSSEASALMGENRYKDVLDVYEDKIGVAEPVESNYRMRRGLAMEPGIREEFTLRTGIATQRRGLLANKERPYMRASVDSLTSDGGILEIKTTSYHNRRDWDEEEGRVPPEAYWQVQHSMGVTGRSHAWVAADVGGDFMIIRVDRNDDDIEALRGAVDELWDRKEAGNPPEPNSLEKIQSTYSTAESGKKTTATPEVEKAVSQFATAKEDEAAAKERQKTARAVIEGHMKDAEELVAEDGTRLATNRQNSTFSKSKFTKEHPELAKQFTVQKEDIDTKALSQAHPDLYTEFRARRFSI
ncbi:YqaJ viral recombinase family protein [Nesterenkonia lacusekhoensis]|uniref:Phage-type endonuclease n=1 Tax=Nesterenkonia lacusekhoensis TaxID=150832 RepID=A0ABS4SZU6_9MICC|nr:YqaJ viral recombinase family protein [Nesterenkonia lacusekhoensis]MBP2317729.1 putative phage-type endonuclease [Nesterenkonia lacusekhoensis]